MTRFRDVEYCMLSVGCDGKKCNDKANSDDCNQLYMGLPNLNTLHLDKVRIIRVCQ